MIRLEAQEGLNSPLNQSCATKVNTIVETTKYANKTHRKDTDTADE